MIGVVEKPDGSLVFVIPAEGVDPEEESKRLGLGDFKGVVDSVPTETVNVPIEENGSIREIPSSERHFRSALKWDGGVKIDPVKKKEVQWESVREARNRLLEKTDVEVVKAMERSDPNLNSLKIYRQRLRDIPQDYSDPFNVIWPPKP